MKGVQGAVILAVALVCAGLWLLECDSRLEGDVEPVSWVQPRTPEEPGYRLLDHLMDSRVQLDKEGRVEPFKLKNGTFVAPKGSPKWLWVGPVQAEIPIDGDPVWSKAVPKTGGKAETLCIWAHPAQSGKLQLTWPAVPAGKLHGLLHFLPAADDKAGVRMWAYWNGTRVLDLAPATRHGKSQFFQVRLPGSDSATGELRLEIETRMKGRNHICLDGWIVPAEDQDAGLPRVEAPDSKARSTTPADQNMAPSDQNTAPEAERADIDKMESDVSAEEAADAVARDAGAEVLP